MKFLSEEISNYLEHHTQEEPPILKKLNRETYANVLMPRMLSGHLQGRTLSFLSKMISPQYILEIGTYTGYSAICLAEGLKNGGKIITIDNNEELEDFSTRYFRDAGIENKVDLKIGDALEIIPNLEMTFDLVFIDADKANYSQYYDLIMPKTRKGGYILADNVLWSGKVLDDSAMDEDTIGLRKFNKMVQNDPASENLMLPIRDGLSIIRKK